MAIKPEPYPIDLNPPPKITNGTPPPPQTPHQALTTAVPDELKHKHILQWGLSNDSLLSVVAEHIHNLQHESSNLKRQPSLDVKVTGNDNDLINLAMANEQLKNDIFDLNIQFDQARQQIFVLEADAEANAADIASMTKLRVDLGKERRKIVELRADLHKMKEEKDENKRLYLDRRQDVRKLKDKLKKLEDKGVFTELMCGQDVRNVSWKESVGARGALADCQQCELLEYTKYVTRRYEDIWCCTAVLDGLVTAKDGNYYKLTDAVRLIDNMHSCSGFHCPIQQSH